MKTVKIDGWWDGRMVGRTDSRMVGWTKGGTVGQTDGRTGLALLMEVRWCFFLQKKQQGLFLAAYTLRIAPGSTFGVLECVGGFWALQTYFCGTKPEDFIREDTHVWCVYKGKGATKTIQSKYEKIHFS